MTRPPKFTSPLGACDSHIHVYGDPAQFPSLPVHGREMEPHFLDGYIALRDALGLSRTVIIQTPRMILTIRARFTLSRRPGWKMLAAWR